MVAGCTPGVCSIFSSSLFQSTTSWPEPDSNATCAAESPLAWPLPPAAPAGDDRAPTQTTPAVIATSFLARLFMCVRPPVLDLRPLATIRSRTRREHRAGVRGGDRHSARSTRDATPGQEFISQIP